MKSGVTPVLSSAWWKANKATLISADPLEKALKKYEVAKNTFDQARGHENGDGYPTYQAAKLILSSDVLKAVETTISSCNKLLHKDDIAGLTKYKTTIIPAEKTELDKQFNAYKAKHENALNAVQNKMLQFVQALGVIANLSGITVEECESAAPEADKALAEAVSAKGDPKKANGAMAKANQAGLLVSQKLQILEKAIKDGPKDFGYDASKAVSTEDRKTLNKIVDRRSTLDEQIKNNLSKVQAIKKTVDSVMSKTRQLAEGSANAETELKAAFDRIVNRAFALGQTNDVPAREMKAAISNLDGDLTAYAKATTGPEKATHKKNAVENLRRAKVNQAALRSALVKGKAEMDGLLKSLPANIVNRQNKAFADLYVLLDRAMKAFDEDTATLTKESQKLTQLEPKVNQLT